MTLDLASVKAVHRPFPANHRVYCYKCSEDYPCPTIRLVEEVERLTEERDRYRMMYEEESER